MIRLTNYGEGTLAKTARVKSRKIHNPRFSVVIPTLNEEFHLPQLLRSLKSIAVINQIIVVDGGSADNTATITKDAAVEFMTTDAGRAKQMNFGAKHAKHKILLFLHADVVLPQNFESALLEYASSDGDFANFRLQFDDDHWWLKLQAYFTNYRSTVFQFGDQGLLIRKEFFNLISGFNQELFILEDQDLVKRAKKAGGKFLKMSTTLKVSARKYIKHGRYRLQLIYFFLYLCYRMGVSQARLKRFYQRLLN